MDDEWVANEQPGKNIDIDPIPHAVVEFEWPEDGVKLDPEHDDDPVYRKIAADIPVTNIIGCQFYLDNKLVKQAAAEDDDELVGGYEPWIGVDLDGTLAVELHPFDAEKMGRPVPEMVAKVKTALEQGKKVKIFTARMAEDPEATAKLIGDWTEEHIGTRLEVTNIKDPGLIEIWDDRAKQVDRDTGVFKTADWNKMKVVGHKSENYNLFAAKIASVDELDNLPDAAIISEPGTRPIPAGTIRLFHYTGGEGINEVRSNLASIMDNGLGMQHAKGENYGEPNMVWGSTEEPRSFKYFVEFWANRMSLRSVGRGATQRSKRLIIINKETMTEH